MLVILDSEGLSDNEIQGIAVLHNVSGTTFVLPPTYSNAMIGAIGVHPDASAFEHQMRTFAPRLGVAEDPDCGSMNASVARWAIRTEFVPTGYCVSQGQRVSRAGEITVR